MILISSLPNKDGTWHFIANTGPVSMNELDAVLATATPEQQADIHSLHRYEWSPAPLDRANVFKPSASITTINAERRDRNDNLALTIKHSYPGR